MKNKWSWITRATKNEKQQMKELIVAENEFEQIENHGIDDNDNDCPITYKLESHKGWQAQAYMPNGKMMDGFHVGFARCGNCGNVMMISCDENVICPDCFTIFE